ncbi:MAG TPA: D-aminoacyl-tRNA deacylase [Bacteroidales bacterium]|nr:D-aminoacyl-tRNA deacylase [Bacteroidales bacterium]HRR93331.1 D-aminoacyl-tRNA deacylase [Bacteroidales bacterium]HRT88546.1 D-aminoacyl-tRNA deacylase [Bacteroidales bacterium]
MRAVIQRVKKASVTVEGKITASCGKGMLVLLGIEDADDIKDAEWLANKIVNLRIFPDKEGVMNLGIKETGGDIIVVSQFTLHALTRKGNRPSYIRAASPGIAIPLYNSFIDIVTSLHGRRPGTGIFGAMMDVELINDGPVTIIIDTKNKDF